MEELINSEVEIETFEIKTEVSHDPEASEIDKIHEVPLDEKLRMSDSIRPDIQEPSFFTVKLEPDNESNNKFDSKMPDISEEFCNEKSGILQAEAAYCFIVDNHQSIKVQFREWETNIGEKSIMWSYWEDDFARLEKRLIVMSDLRVRIFLRLNEVSIPGRDSVEHLEDIVQLLKEISKISPCEEADGENRLGTEHKAYSIQRFQLSNKQQQSGPGSLEGCNSDKIDSKETCLPNNMSGTHVDPNVKKGQNNIYKTISTTDITGLRDFLSQDLDGLSIVNSYKKRGILIPRVRENLVHKLIKREEDILFSTHQEEDSLLQFTISAERLKNIASDIISLFPTEAREVYYVPFKTIKTDGASTRINTSGKLYEHFLYRRSVLMEAGVIAPRRPSKAILNHTTATVRKATSSDENKLDYIKNTIDPTPKLLEYWKETSPVRKHEFDEGSMGIEELFKKYRCLQTQIGSELLKIDFNHLKPGKSEIFFKRWPVIRSRLVELLQGPRMPKKEVNCVLVQKLKHLLPVAQDAIVLYLLPTMIRPKNVGRPGKNPDEADSEVPCKKRKRARKAIQKTKSKASEEESQEAFFIVVPTEASIEAAVKARKQELQKRDLSLQFLPVFVGILEEIESSYVYISTDIKYRVESPMHAIDLALKLFYALDCEYPSDAAHVWLFIQQVGFCIVNPLDRFSPTMNALRGEIESVFTVKNTEVTDSGRL